MKLKENSVRVAQLLQIAKTPIWDGDLISKDHTKQLIQRGLVFEQNGFNCISKSGIVVLDALGFIRR